MKKIPLATVALLIVVAPASAFYQGALKYRDRMIDAALVFAYYEKCNAGQIPADLKKRAEENLKFAGPSAAAWSKGDVASMIKKIGVKSFCEEYRHELTTG